MVSFSDIAAWLSADLGTLGERWSVKVVAEGGVDDRMRRDAAALGLPTGEPLPQALAVKHDGVEFTRVSFWTGQEIMPQLEDAIDQIQDLVAEVTTEQLPRCPHHRHALTPQSEAESIGWVCPSSRQVIVPIGGLSQLDQ
jgi:hypothetical protein